MKRRGLIGVLLGLAAIAVAAGIWSYWRWTGVHVQVPPNWTFSVGAARGTFVIGVGRFSANRTFDTHFIQRNPVPSEPVAPLLGFAFGFSRNFIFAGVPV